MRSGGEGRRASAQAIGGRVASAFVVLALGGSTSCECNHDPVDYRGSVWSYEIALTEAPTPGTLELLTHNFAITRTRMQGRFRVTDREVDDRNDDIDEYEVELLPGTVAFDVLVAPWRASESASPYIYDECDGYSGAFQRALVHDERSPFDSIQLLHEGDGFAAIDLMFASAEGVRGRFQIDWAWTGASTAYPLHCRSGDTRFGTVIPNDRISWGDPTLPWSYLPAQEGHFLTTKVGGNFGDITYGASLRLRCDSGCEPVRDTELDPAPEPESPACDLESLRRECRSFRDSIIGFCNTLDNWMVVYSDTSLDEPEYTCATSDCSSAIADHAASDPWTGITKTLDLACEGEQAGQEICHVECYGWNPLAPPR